MEYLILNLDNITESQLIDAINENARTAKLMMKEIKKLEETNKEYLENNPVDKTNNSSIELVDASESINMNEKDQEFEDEVDYYFSLLTSLYDSEYLLYDIANILPSKKKNNYSKLIMRLKFEFLKNIKQINDLLELEKDNLHIEDLEEFKEEISLNKKIISTITEIENSSEDYVEEHIDNNLILIPNASGNFRVLDEIKSMDIEYLESFKELFDTIKDGTFKRVKRFNSTNNKISGISQVKNFKTRVIFDRIGKNDYVVISAFMKKCDNDKGYKESLELKIRRYLKQKDKIRELLLNDEFRKNCEFNEKQLYDLLPSFDHSEYKKEM